MDSASLSEEVSKEQTEAGVSAEIWRRSWKKVTVKM